MNAMGLHAALGGAFLLVTTGLVGSWVADAGDRLNASEASKDENAPQVAVAAAAEVGYCSSELKPILKRVLTSCGLMGSGGGGRGCQPLEARSVAAMAGDDFNALFSPLAERAAILQFDQDSDELDEQGIDLLSKTFADQQGASYFFVVSRSSPEGSAKYNQQLSERRGTNVMTHLREMFDDPDLDKEVGILFLGEEFAQLDTSFCDWTRSRPGETCGDSELNRSAFIAWIDCRL